MQLTIDVDLDEIEPIAVTGDGNHVLSRDDVQRSRRKLIDREMVPQWIIVDQSGFMDLKRQDGGAVTIDTIMQNIWVEDYQDALDRLHKVVGENAEGVYMGMGIISDNSLQPKAYVTPDSSGLPCMDSVVEVDY